MKKIISVIVALLSSLCFLPLSAQTVYRQLKIRDKVFTVEISDTLAKRSLGLGKRQNLPEDHGMFFIFERKGIYPFWMKDMKFPIDIVWINNDRVIGVTERIPQPKGKFPLAYYAPPSLIDRVLELNSGTAKIIGIKEGDTVTIFGEQ